jgi:hypothetical protein
VTRLLENADELRVVGLNHARGAERLGNVARDDATMPFGEREVSRAPMPVRPNARRVDRRESLR